MPRTCIFCQNQAGSSEHIWADWINGVLAPHEPDGDTFTGWIRQYDREDDSELKWFASAKIANLTTNTLCHDCNTQWMSRLEGLAKPILEPIILGRGATLRAIDQIVVGTWAVKTVIVLQSTFPEGVRFLQTERQIVKEQSRPPTTTRVFIAGVLEPFAGLGYGEIGFLDGEDDLHARYQFSTLQVGHLVVQVVRDATPPEHIDSIKSVEVPRELDVPSGVTISIFPPLPSIEWPPTRVLKGEALVGFMRRGTAVPNNWLVPSRYEGPDQRLRRPNTT